MTFLIDEFPYTREIGDYKKAETDLINRSIENLDWSIFFLGKNVHEQVEIFDETILNTFHNFIPNKTILCDSWLTRSMKKSNYWVRRNMLPIIGKWNFDCTTLDTMTSEVWNAISASETKHY